MSRSTSSVLPARDEAEARRRGRLKALFILAVCAAPTIAAYVAFYIWPPEGRGNYGELIDPRPVSAAPLVGSDGRPFSFADLKGKWVLVQADDARCEAACEAKLFNMRQSRLAQGREMDRIDRVWLLTDDAALSVQVARLADGVHLARARGTTALDSLPAAESVRDHIYVVDPLGNVMMRFPRDADPRKMMKDVSRLLKVSRVG